MAINVLIESFYKPARRLMSAIQFLTILPLGKSDEFDPKGMIAYFPLVGIVLGALVSMFDHLVLGLWPAPVAALLDVLCLVLLTGGLHLDGLGDTADGLYGHHSREKALAIMKDSHIGVMGLLGIVSVLAVKWVSILSLSADRTLMLILIPAYARGAMIFGIHYLDYGRPEGGTGHALFKAPLRPAVFGGLLVPLMLSVFLGWSALQLNIIFVILTAAILLYYRRRIGCITGDMLGAQCELTEAGLLLAAAAGSGL